MAGNATVGLEIVEDLPDVDAVLVPYGGGGFAVSVASAVKALQARSPGLCCGGGGWTGFRGVPGRGQADGNRASNILRERNRLAHGLRGRVAPGKGAPGRLSRVDTGGYGETRSGSLRRGPGSWRRERERLQWRGPYRAGRVMGRSPASCRAATSTPRSSPKSCAAASPDTSRARERANSLRTRISGRR